MRNERGGRTHDYMHVCMRYGMIISCLLWHDWHSMVYGNTDSDSDSDSDNDSGDGR